MNFQGIEIPDKRPRIIALCGSSRFVEQFAVMQWNFEKGGVIALGLHLLPHSYYQQTGIVPVEHHEAEHEGVADQLDALHLKKIEMADSVYVLNIGGYIGESTAREIAYAKKLGKPISYHEDEIVSNLNLEGSEEGKAVENE